jgi:hypothetical protein
MIKPEPKPPLDDEDLRAIGAVTANFAALEQLLHYLIWSLVGGDQRTSQIITTEYPFRSLPAVAFALVKHRASAGPTVKKCEKLMKRIERLELQRDQLTHSFCVKDKAREQLVLAKASLRVGAGWSMSQQWMTLNEVNQLADEIDEAGTEVLQLLVETT